ncbi:hypothetical protein PHSC3_001397 [Chlamydiales bacterium STE3]|nr:hypothetical protein PHSC3_001397 [Chlamydiales bacterium STE3]
MNKVKSLYHFLGGVIFAVILISLTALMVAYGTYLESITESHQVAAENIYKSLFFKILLAGYFINILVSALRRWPFKKKHFPFLITHLGLLMVISGTFIKTVYGTQGHALLVEGSSSSHIQFPEEMVITAEERGTKKQLSLPLKKDLFGNYYLPKNMFCQLLDYSPHAEKNLFSWIAGSQAQFIGKPNFPAQRWKPGESIPSENPLALITDFKLEAIQALLAEKITVRILDREQHKLADIPLKKLLLQKKEVQEWSIGAQLNVEEAAITLEITYEKPDRKGSIQLNLNGPFALLNNHHELSYLGQAPLDIELISHVPDTWLQDSKKDTIILIADPHGRIYTQNFESNRLHSYIAYNEGFDGYSLQADFFGLEANLSKKQFENHLFKVIREELGKELKTASIELAPIQLFKNSCENCQLDFSKEFLDFLRHWHQQGGWLYPKEAKLPKKFSHIFKNFDWNSLSANEIKGALWLSHFFSDFDDHLLNGESFLSILKERQWPLLYLLETLPSQEEQLTLFSQQLFSMGEELPWISFPQDTNTLARVFTAYLRTVGIHYSHITYPALSQKALLASFESPIFRESAPLPSLKKIEDNLPRIIIAKDDEKIPLVFDRLKSDLKWPTKDRRYLLSFQPKVEELPYTIRLHRAQQINYPETNQPFSYESEVTFKDRRTSQEVRKTISMNEVYETRDGYRFYLSGLSKNPSGAHLVQLVINRDPAKYWLTYPGAILVALGILLLFWWKRR